MSMDKKFKRKRKKQEKSCDEQDCLQKMNQQSAALLCQITGRKAVLRPVISDSGFLLLAFRRRQCRCGSAALRG